MVVKVPIYRVHYMRESSVFRIEFQMSLDVNTTDFGLNQSFASIFHPR